MPVIFVTGTDTGVGKTQVTCQLLRAAHERGIDAVGYKPVESGCPVAGQPGEDACDLAAAGSHPPLFEHCFKPAVSPHLAAAAAKVEVTIAPILDRVSNLSRKHDLVFVEGAGGFLVPLSESESIASLAQALTAPILLVSADKLGTINHTLLSLEAIAARELVCAAVALNQLEPEDSSELANLPSLRAQQPSTPIVPIPYQKRFSAASSPSPALGLLLDTLLS